VAEYLREFETEFENMLGVNQGPRASGFMKKNRSKKSRETVSLKHPELLHVSISSLLQSDIA
jgi:hypothetical protein